ncbi:hypothetical protein [Pseudomonas chlororaphis]|uniref:hypothetical protein n=1 Tax=Pseudomonas chlororaphis TaxID=587753 RepID=UPI0012D302E8|nr:hypothetical protein [Pseudomonas chlororaphis]
MDDYADASWQWLPSSTSDFVGPYTLITSHAPYIFQADKKGWGSNRIVHNAHAIPLKGESMRKLKNRKR